MSADPFHLGWFMNGMRAHGWQDIWGGTGGRSALSPDFYLDFARQLERACFDYIIIEDSSFVADAWQGKRDFYLENAFMVPKLDPQVLASMLTQVTSKLGIAVTCAVTEYPPYLLARMVSTLDHVSHGRAGWNMVTASSDRAAQNYGHDRQPDHDVRYEMATEFTELVWQLWESWEPGSVLVDQAQGVFADPTKVHTVDFEGRFYKSRGPINTARSPQGKPVIVQAGGSDPGREYASRFADTVIASGTSIEGIKAYRDDVRARAVRHGRDPDDVKLLFVTAPVLGATEAEAQGRVARSIAQANADPQSRLAAMGYSTDIDYSSYDMDVPIRELAAAGLMTTNGHRSGMEALVRNNGDKSLRDYVTASVNQAGGQRLDFIGTPDQVAGQMDEVMQEVGGDGFLIKQDTITRRAIAEITEGLVPALQRRGLVRTSYTYDQFRDNLLEF